MAATRTIGQMHEFLPERETVTAYLERFQLQEVPHDQRPCLWWTCLLPLLSFAVGVVVGSTHLRNALTLEKAIEISQGIEAAAKQSKELKGAGGPSRSTPVLVVDVPTLVAKLCGRCGRGKHSPAECKFKSATCHKCGKVGHIAPACRSKKNFKSPQKAQWVDSSEPSTPTTASLEEPLYVINHHSSPPYRVQLQVQGTPLTMEVDTGAAVSLAPESAVAPFLTSSKLLPSTVVLTTYTGERIQVKGTLQVNVEYGQQ